MALFIKRSKLFLFIAAAVAGMLVGGGCSKKPPVTELIEPGIGAGGIVIGTDDSVAVVKKIGLPDYKSPSPFGNVLWMYPQKGLGLQFGTGRNIYKAINDVDSTVSQIFMFNAQTIDNKKFTMCNFRTADGLSLDMKAPDVFKRYGKPLLKQAPIGAQMDENFSGVLYYPGFEVSFEMGRMRWISVIYLPPGDTTIAHRVESEPIVPGSSLGGISLGMTEDQVHQLLGDTRYKYQKLDADFWYYPQYAIKVQFGVPPIEGQLVNKFLDTAYTGKVTGITAVPLGYFEGVLSAEQYKGMTPDSIGITTPAYLVRQNGDPLEPPNPNLQTGTIRAKYKGIVFYFDTRTQDVNHIFVTNTDLNFPLEEVSH